MSETDPSTAAVRALTLGLVNEQALSSHEELCAERMLTINAKIDRIETILKWFGGMIVSVVISVLGWAISQQIETTKANQAAAAAKIELLQKQVNDSTAARRRVIDQLDRIEGDPGHQ